MVISILNLDKCLKKLGNLEGIDLMPAITRGTRKVQRSARDFVPVDTGILKGSIRTQLYPKQQTGVVYTTTEYAPYVEFGTRKMPAQPFMVPAAQENQKVIEQDITDHVKSELKQRSK